MKTRRQLAAVVFIAVLLALSPVIYGGKLEPNEPPGPTMKPLDEVEPRISIKASDLPLTITKSGSYYLMETVNFSDPNTDCITIIADDVAINLNGYALIGPGKTTGDNGHGIHASTNQITITNGAVSGWRNFAVNLSGSSNLIKNIKTWSNGANGISMGSNAIVIECASLDNEATGIAVGSRSVIEACSSYYNEGTGISAGESSVVKDCSSCRNDLIGFSVGVNCSLTNCTANDNDTGGIDAGRSSVIENCAVEENGTTNENGISAGDNSTITNCTANNNAGTGIDGGTDSVIADCVANDNYEDGIYAYYSRIRDCVANNNTRYGIYAKQRCLVTGCVCDGNGTGIYTTSHGSTFRHNSLSENNVGLDAGSNNYAAQNSFYSNNTNWQSGFKPGSGDMANIAIP